MGDVRSRGVRRWSWWRLAGAATVALIGSTSMATVAHAATSGAGETFAYPGVVDVLRADVGPAQHTYVPPSAARVQAPAATINVTYSGFTPAAQAAFEAAATLWEQVLTSPVPIQVEATFGALPAGTLALAQLTTIHRNFSGAMQPDTFYSPAVANAQHGSDLSPTTPDVRVTVNNQITNWYYGTNGQVPVGQYDFVSAAMHEIGHSLAFTGSLKSSGGIGSWGYDVPTPSPAAYDRWVTNAAGVSLVTGFGNFTTALGAQLAMPMRFNGPLAVAAYGGPVPVHSPPTFLFGGSIVHLDENAFPRGSTSSLMTPLLATGEAVHGPGPVGAAMMADAGWPRGPVAPSVSIGDLSKTEGNSGTKQANFVLTLSVPASSSVSVSYTTADGTAASPGDYTRISGTATFPVGALTQTVTVDIVGDTEIELDETFSVVLSNPVNATLGDGTAIGTIKSDDAAPPLSISVGDVTRLEGDTGPMSFSFKLTLSRPNDTAVSVTYATANGTASAPLDFVAIASTVATMPAGTTSKTIKVTVNGDSQAEANEMFMFMLSNPVGVMIGDGTAAGTITNDD